MVFFVSYAAIILSFTGGINWILAMQKPVVYVQEGDQQINIKRMLLAVMPCFTGEIAVILTIYTYHLSAILLLIASYLFLFSYERKLYLSSELPGGYFLARWIITTLMAFGLISAFIARLI